ncbi:glycosyltransferase family 10 [Pontiellaceae bacterium B1224]|nr:glycosyltransferase family 10 [Pontiellaceae bacterium B1224]
MKRVRLVSNDDASEWIRKATPGGRGIWRDIQFFSEDIPECDYCIFHNNSIRRDIVLNCPPENIWVLMQEPYFPGLTDWVVEKHEPFGRVYTHRRDSSSAKYRNTQTALPWHVGKTYDQLKAMTEPPEKSRDLSAIIGGARDLPGHRVRFGFIQAFKKSGLPLDLFGKEVNPIEDKADALEPYFYSLAIENNCNPDMWTEKLADCFLSWTVPFYFGCTNLDKYFPAGSYIPIDINRPEQAMAVIREQLAAHDWSSRVDALREARERVLEHYQLIPFLANEIAEAPPTGASVRQTIPAYSRSLKAKIAHMKYKWERSIRKRTTDKPW